jgi:L-aminopeptidase/D-esterase-like protein
MENVTRANSLTDVQGIVVGHFTDFELLTGVTVVLTGDGAVAGVDVRGGAPGTRETDLLDPVNLVERVHAVAICGNSAYGLNAVGGVMRFLEERGVGFSVGDGRVVPIVPAAVLFDLGRGQKEGHISEEFGYRACENATKGPIPQGNVGAGAGAVTGGLKGGIGTASDTLDSGIIVGGLVALNSFGSPVDPETGQFYGRYLEKAGEFANLKPPTPLKKKVSSPVNPKGVGRHTTIGVVTTDANLTKTQATRVAQMAHDGLARAIWPVHTIFDGDTVFVLATGQIALPEEKTPFGSGIIEALNQLGVSAADVLSRAVIHAVLAAETVGPFLSFRDTYPDSLLQR